MGYQYPTLRLVPADGLEPSSAASKAAWSPRLAGVLTDGFEPPHRRAYEAPVLARRSPACRVFLMDKRLNALGQRRRSIAARGELLALLGNKCRCGFSDPRALQIDHVNGGGSRERVRFSSGFYRRVLRLVKSGSAEYQLLCANCNSIKRYEHGELNVRKYPDEPEPTKKPLRPCGTHSAYHRGCRCDLCKRAHCAYVRAARLKAKKIGSGTCVAPG